MGQNARVDIVARSMAFHVVLVFLAGTLVGGLAHELGNILALTSLIRFFLLSVSLALVWYVLLDVESISESLRFWW